MVEKIQVPFELLLIFATNLDVTELVDDAFMLFRAYADRSGVPHDRELVKLVLGWYAREQRRMSSCEPLLEVAWPNYFCT